MSSALRQVVDRDGVEGGVDEVVERDRVADALVDGAPQRADDEVLLAADAAEVAGGVGAPAPVLRSSGSGGTRT